MPQWILRHRPYPTQIMLQRTTCLEYLFLSF